MNDLTKQRVLWELDRIIEFVSVVLAPLLVGAALWILTSC